MYICTVKNGACTFVCGTLVVECNVGADYLAFLSLIEAFSHPDDVIGQGRTWDFAWGMHIFG
jgi:hypothetical protein